MVRRLRAGWRGCGPWRPASWRARPAAGLGALLLAACQHDLSQPPVAIDSGGQVGTGAVGTGAVGTGAIGTGAVGAGAVGAGAVGAGAVGAGGAVGGSAGVGQGAVPSKGLPGIPAQAACVPTEAPAPEFEGHVPRNLAPAQRVLYSWTTPEQVQQLRRDRQLLLRSEQAGMGRGYAFDVIAGLAMNPSPLVGRELAKRLTTDLFPKIRYAWPQPWATRMGWPGESYGNQLLRIVLNESAWTAVVMRGDIFVVDSANHQVGMDAVLATPERIGAIFFVKDAASGGAGCSLGSFSTTGEGATYREFIVGNEAMVEEWSLGTADILAQLEADIGELTAFLARVRACPRPVGDDWRQTTACKWEGLPVESGDAAENYLSSLSLANDYYLPLPSQLASLIDTLRGDLFEPEPLLVRPGE